MEERLELGDLFVSDPAPFPLPEPADQKLLREQRLYRAKEITYHPQRGRLTGCAITSSSQAQRLRNILHESLDASGRWLATVLPRYGGDIQPLRVGFQPEEEATRCLRMSARNDLLHVDATRPVRGARLLRLSINLNPFDARVCVTSDPLTKVLPLYGPRSGLLVPPALAWPYRVGQRLLGLFRPHRLERSPYDDFMLAFSHFLKLCDEFQDKSPRKLWHFAPFASWLAFTDGLVHAELRGRWILDHFFLVPQARWTRPEAAPLSLLDCMGLSVSTRRAA